MHACKVVAEERCAPGSAAVQQASWHCQSEMLTIPSRQWSLGGCAQARHLPVLDAASSSALWLGGDH